MALPKARPQSEEVVWKTLHPGEVAVQYGDRYLRIKQSVGPVAKDTYWACYSTLPGEKGQKYIGAEHKLEVAKARCISGRMRCSKEELELWLKDFGPELPHDLLVSEKERLAEHKKNPPKKMAEPPPPVAKGVRPAEAKVTARRTGRLSGDMIVRIIKPFRPVGKKGGKWWNRQQIVLAKDGHSVSTFEDVGAIRHMLKDGTITVEEE